MRALLRPLLIGVAGGLLIVVGLAQLDDRDELLGLLAVSLLGLAVFVYELQDLRRAERRHRDLMRDLGLDEHDERDEPDDPGGPDR